MNSKMDSNNVVPLLGCVGKAVVQKMLEIIGTVPVCGKPLNAQPPVFMDCFIFRCKPGCTLPAAKQDMLADIFEGEREDESGKISSFIFCYIGDIFGVY